MTRFRKQFRYGEKGFTLVELLIVVAILGILAAVAIPNLITFIGEGQTEAEATEKDVVQTAVIGLLAKAGVAELDCAVEYPEVDTYVEVCLVLAGGGAHSLDDFLMMEAGDTFYVAYDIAKDGLVTVD